MLSVCESGILVGYFDCLLVGGDGVIDAKGLVVFLGQWLKTGQRGGDIEPSLGGDGVVNWRNFAVVAENYLRAVE